MTAPILEEIFENPRPHQVYVIHDAASQCLYVGSAGVAKWRIPAHRSKSWWPLVAHVSVIDTASKRDALDLEAALQEAFQPIYATTPTERLLLRPVAIRKAAATREAHAAGRDCRRAECGRCGRPWISPERRRALAVPASGGDAKP